MYSASFIGAITDSGQLELSATLGSELLVDNAGTNIATTSAVRIDNNRILWVGGKGNNFIHVGIVNNNAGVITNSGKITLSGSTNVANDDRAIGAGADQTNKRAVIAGWDRMSGGSDGNGIDVWAVRDTGTGVVEDAFLNFTVAGSSPQVGGVDVAFMGADGSDSYFAVAYIVDANNASDNELRIVAFRYNRSGNSLHQEGSITLDGALSASEASVELIGIRAAARSNYDVIVTLQGGYWHRTTYNTSTDSWTDLGEYSTLNGVAQATITSAKESILNDYRSCVVLSGLTSSNPTSIQIQFIDTAIVGNNNTVSSNASWDDTVSNGESYRGLLPNGIQECVATVWKDFTSSDLHVSFHELISESVMGSRNCTTVKTGVSVVYPFIAQFNNSQWGIIYRDNNRSGYVYCQLINVNG